MLILAKRSERGMGSRSEKAEMGSAVSQHLEPEVHPRFSSGLNWGSEEKR